MMLRPYQAEAIEAVLRDWQTHADLLLVAATGAGKTVMFLDILRRVLHPGQRALIIAHRQELIEQPKAMAPAAGVVMADVNECDRPITIATVQTLANPVRLAALLAHGAIDYLITDEAHHANAAQYLALTAALRLANPALRHLGVTATPFRTDEDGLARVFSHVAARITIADLVSDRYLVQPRWFGIYTGIDLKGVQVTVGDFAQGALARRYDTPEGHAIVVKAYQEYASGRHALAFTASRQGANDLAAAFRAAGIVAAAVDGTTPKPERDAIKAQFRAGTLQVVCNCQVFTEGFDVPRADCVLMARPTRSDGLYVQMMGRGLRPSNPDAEGKCAAGEQCIILDFMPKDTRNIVMAGDVLGLPKEVMERVLEVEGSKERGAVQAAFTFDGVQLVSDRRPFEVVARELEYLEEQAEKEIGDRIRALRQQGMTKEQICKHLHVDFYVVQKVLGRVHVNYEDPGLYKQIYDWDIQGIPRVEMARRIGGSADIAHKLIGRLLGPKKTKAEDPGLPALIRSWHEQGCSRTDIAKMIGGTKTKATKLMLEVLGLYKTSLLDLPREEMLNKIRELSNQGYSRSKIAHMLGRYQTGKLIVDQALGPELQKEWQGVYREHGKYRARIRVNGLAISLGMHPTAEDAARAYNRAAREHFGDKAKLNDVPEESD